ncbi:MAG: DUF2812 domain-containing protein [Oscillospiraceae bacterium]
MKTGKTLWHSFNISAFDEELGLLNEMSERGWQLQDMRMFYQKYVRDDSVVYRYAIDCPPELSAFEFNQYRTEFADQGWTYVPTHGRTGLYVFRKPYDPSLPEAEYLLYTDEFSFQDMKSRLTAGINLFGIIWLPEILLSRPCMPTLLLALSWLIVAAADFSRQRRLKRVRRVPKKYRFHLWRYSGLVASLLLVLWLAYLFGGNSSQMSMMSGPTTGTQSTEFTVKAPELYGLEMEINRPMSATDAGTMLRYPVFTITDERGQIVDSGVLYPDGERTYKFFRAGTYSLSVDWDAACAPGESLPNDGTVYSIHLTYHSSLLPDVPLWVYTVWYFGWLAVFLAIYGARKRRLDR